MIAVLASGRREDRALVDETLERPACPVDDVLRVGSRSLLLRVAARLDPDLVILGDVPVREAGEEPKDAEDVLPELEERTPPPLSVIQLVDRPEAGPGGGGTPDRVDRTFVRGDVSPERLAGAVREARRASGSGDRGDPDEDGELDGDVPHGAGVAEQQGVEAEIDETARLLDGVVESVPDAIYAKDRAGRYLMMNSGGAELFGMTVDEVAGKTDYDLFTEADAAGIREDDRQVMASDAPIQFREQARIHHGETRYFDVTKAPLRRRDGSVSGVVGISRDITDRVRAEQALERSEEKHEKLFQATPMGIALSTLDDGTILEVNEGFEELLGHSREELVDRRAVDLSIWPEIEERRRLVRAILEEGEARKLDVTLRRKDGRVIEVEMFGEAIEIDERRCILTVTRDVTDQRESQRELARSRDKLQQYADHLTSARERERKQLARDIHDELGQLLTAVRLKVARIAKVSERGEELPPEEFGAITGLIDRGVEEIRNLCTSLRPSALDQFGLMDAIRWQAERAADRFDLDVAVRSELEELQLGGEKEIHVFRVIQEALTNVGRHAGADSAAIELDRDDGRLVIRVLDDGVGVGPGSQEASDSYGLLGMEERAHVLGGEFSLRDRTGDGGGTEARLELPYGGQ